MPFRMGGAAWPWVVAAAAAGAATWWYRRTPATALAPAARMSSGGSKSGLDPTDRTVADSFPASDPPAWSGATASTTGADRSDEHW